MVAVLLMVLFLLVLFLLVRHGEIESKIAEVTQRYARPMTPEIKGLAASDHRQSVYDIHALASVAL